MNAVRRSARWAMAAAMLVAQLAPSALVSQPAHAAALPAASAVHDPPIAPHQILVFPQRDFVSASGYAPDDLVVVTVQHPDGTVFTTDPANPIVPQADPRAAPGAPFAGIVEVNHPGGACWFGTTPNIRPGDLVRVTIVGGPNAGTADQTPVANVTAQRPVQTDATTVKVHGTAMDALGKPFPLAQLEQRIVANRQVFLINGRRVLTSAKDGTLAYDPVDPVTNPTGINWTATYTGLPAADVTRALGAESRILWNGRDPLAAVEGTIFENGAGIVNGPAAPCTAPAEFVPPPPGGDVTPPSAPSGLAFTVANANNVTLTWTAATDNVGVTSYGVYRDGVAIFNVQNPDGSAPAPTTFTDANVPPGTYLYTVDAADFAGNRSGLSNAVSVTTTQQLAALPAGTLINEPPAAPVQIISFPSRDFISSSGFLPTDTVQVQLLRKLDAAGLAVISTSTVTPVQDPRAAPTDPFAGIVEVNHPGGGCWDGVTPDIRVGDIVRTIAYNPDGTIRTVDQTTTANVIAERPILVQNASSATAADGIIQVHGMAMDAQGNPLPLDSVESRLIANRDHFVLNGRRVIRAGGAGKDGVLAYDVTDPTGVHWTATYSGLVQQDIDRVMGLNGFAGVESRALWLGAIPLAGLELTIYENAADPLASGTVNGPSAGVCFSTAEVPDSLAPSAPTGVTATQTGAKDVNVTWFASTDNVAVYGYRVYVDSKPIRNVGAATTSFLITGVQPGTHTYSVDAMDAASPAAQFANPPTYNSPYGNRSAQTASAPLTQADVTPPSVPANLVASVGTLPGTSNQVTLKWSASTDDVGVTSYRVYRGGVMLADVTGTTTTYTDTVTDPTIVLPATFSYTVDAADAAGNRSAQSAAASATITAVPDLTAPSTPTGLAANVVNLKDVVLTWNAATDNVGVTGYGVYRDGTKIADVPGTSLTYTDTNRPAGIYHYTVDAVDSAANRSPQSAAVTATTVNQPPVAPHSIIAFPQRDFISASGYALSEGPVTVSVMRGGLTISTSTPITPQADPKALPTDPFAGIVEVNHPGGGCWTGVTPDLRPGDIVRTTTAQGISDQIVVQNVTAFRPTLKKAPSAPTATTPNPADGILEVHGIAADAVTGAPLPVASIENRLIANRDAFDLNGRRVLRAGGAGTDGTFAFDAIDPVTNPKGINWTATYTGLDWDDVTRAIGGTSPTTGTVFVGSESRAVWLGADPLAGVDLTIYENSDAIVGGPAAGVCTAPLEAAVSLSSLTPASISFGDQATGSSSAASTVTMLNTGAAPMSIGSVAIVGMNPSDFVKAADTCSGASLAPNASCTVSIKFAPTAVGGRNAGLDFQDSAANATGFVKLSGNGVVPAAPAVSLSPTSLTFASQVVGTTSAAQTVTLTNTGTAPLSVSSVTITGPFAKSSNTCAAASVAPGASCSVGVTFSPTATGTATGSLTFADNAAGSPHSVALSGSGAAKALTAPSTPVLDPASDSGTKGDKLTNVTSPVLTGTAPLGTTVRILSDAVQVGSAPASSTGTYRVTTSVLAEGSHTITAQAVDAAGTTSPASAALVLTIDTTPPVATAPAATLKAGTSVTIKKDPFTGDLSASTMPVTLSWSATDANGITSYQLQKRVDTFSSTGSTIGTFADVTPVPVGPSTTLDLALGQMLALKPITLYSYTFQVRACDAAGNCGTFAAAPTFQLIPVDDSLTGPLLNGAGSVGYSGSWSVGLVANAYNGSVHFSTAIGANAQLNNVTYSVLGDVAWVTTKGPDRGIATVSVDGGPAQTIDLYAPTQQAAQIVFATNGLRSGVQHSVKVTVTGTKNVASISTRVDVDGFMAIH